jgi:hemolysin III
MRREIQDLIARGELLNILTHVVGIALAIAALCVLIASATAHSGPGRMISYVIFGAALVLVYVASTLFHIFDSPQRNGFFHGLDQIAIYLMIAGTYTPFMVLCMGDAVGYTLLGLVWTFAALGIIVRMFLHDRHAIPSYVIFLTMGWCVLLAVKPVLAALPTMGLWWLLAGGLSYTVGVVFLVWHSLPFNHAIWHLFVMGGSACHFFAVLWHT